ncbi:MAG: hypothetical protein LBP53_00140 [Candidatus Peribacteria bacterium]|nr:hypothetical protein [Candidatus Peribacteria bacterium]
MLNSLLFPLLLMLLHQPQKLLMLTAFLLPFLAGCSLFETSPTDITLDTVVNS